jgi:hypothetical protein
MRDIGRLKTFEYKQDIKSKDKYSKLFKSLDELKQELQRLPPEVMELAYEFKELCEKHLAGGYNNTLKVVAHRAFNWPSSITITYKIRVAVLYVGGRDDAWDTVLSVSVKDSHFKEKTVTGLPWEKEKRAKKSA